MIMATGTRISEGNRKMGAVPSVSLLPVVTCPADAPCKSDCYVVRNMLRGPHGGAIRRAYAANTVLQKDDWDAYFGGIVAYILKRMPDYFRWHVSGDIPNWHYLQCMVALANRFPGTRFLAFTKRFDLLERIVSEGIAIPENLALRASEWYGREASETLQDNFWSAFYVEEWTWGAEVTDYVRDRLAYEERARTALRCPGNCADCKACWNASNDVRFHRH